MFYFCSSVTFAMQHVPKISIRSKVFRQVSASVKCLTVSIRKSHTVKFTANGDTKTICVQNVYLIQTFAYNEVSHLVPQVQRGWTLKCWNDKYSHTQEIRKMNESQNLCAYITDIVWIVCQNFRCISESFGISTDPYFPPFLRENISSLWRILIIRIIFLCRSRSAFTVLCTHVSTVCANYVRSCCKNKRILVCYFFRLLAAAKFSNKCRLYGLKMIYNCCVV